MDEPVFNEGPRHGGAGRADDQQLSWSLAPIRRQSLDVVASPRWRTTRDLAAIMSSAPEVPRDLDRLKALLEVGENRSLALATLSADRVRRLVKRARRHPRDWRI